MLIWFNWTQHQQKSVFYMLKTLEKTIDGRFLLSLPIFFKRRLIQYRAMYKISTTSLGPIMVFKYNKFLLGTKIDTPHTKSPFSCHMILYGKLKKKLFRCWFIR